MATTRNLTDRTKIPLILLGVLFLLLAWFGNAAVLAFDLFGYEYSDDVALGSLLGEVTSVSVFDVVRGFFANTFFSWVNVAMLLTLIGVILVEVTAPARANAIRLAIALLSAPLGALALFSLLASAQAGFDGEWLGEGWPILEMFFFWTLALGAYALTQSQAVLGPKSAMNPSPPGA